MNPSFLNLFMKKFTRDRVVPTISASVSWWIILASVASQQQQRTSQALLAGIKKLIDQVLFNPDVARKHVSDETVGKFVLVVQDADHFLLFDDQRRGGRNRSRGPYTDRLTGQASFAEKISRSQDRYHRFLASFIYDGEPHATFSDVQHIGGGIALREDLFSFSKLRNIAGYASRIEETLGIKSGFLRGFSFGSNTG